jgi:hypothetical protein
MNQEKDVSDDISEFKKSFEYISAENSLRMIETKGC